MKNGELKIDKGIPIPLRMGHSKGYSAAVRKLLKGDSVLLPLSTSQASNCAKHILGPGNYAARKEGKGARIWRIK